MDTDDLRPGVAVSSDTNTKLLAGVEGVQSLDRSPSRLRRGSSTMEAEVDTPIMDPGLRTAVPAPVPQTRGDWKEHTTLQRGRSECAESEPAQ